jgi:signal transduction histidine kinase/CheY-like chemotaxis protein
MAFVHDPATLPELIDAAWRQHHRDPMQLLPLGERIVAAAEAAHDEVGVAWGWLQQAWGLRFRSRADGAASALARAQAGFERAGHADGLAACRDLQGMVLCLARRLDEAQALLAQNDVRPGGPRPARERCSTHQRLAWIYDMIGQRDEALRERYALQAAAQESGDGAACALALGMLGGIHADLYNLEEAERLCRQGMELAEAEGAAQAWAMTALNGMNALVAQGRGAEAVPWAEALLAKEPQLNARAREQRYIVYADAFAQAGDTARAQALLDDSRAMRNAVSESLLSWTTAQAVTWALQSKWAELRALAEGWLRDPRVGTDPAQVPSEQLRLLQLASQACEALGDAPAALRWQREAFVLHETLVGRSARARRLALEVQHGLALEVQRRQQAEVERQRLDGLNRALEAANAAKTRFLAAASHDLRQPVQALALNMAALGHESVSPAQAQLVQRMAASLQALTQMFDVLLDISRLDAGIVPVAPQRVALVPLLQRLHGELDASATARGLQLRLHLPPLPPPLSPGATGPCTRSDPVLLERCLRNLLDNALKYTRSGGVLLALRRAGDGWQVQVSDTGVGMTPEVLARACDEFFQADNPERDRSRGLGLGLAIVQRLLRLMGHRLALSSRAGRGTTARVELPHEDAPAQLAPEQADAMPPTPPGSTPGMVAVVDDDAAVRDGLTALLQRWGHTVLQGADDAQLLQAWAAAGRPDVQAVITDYRLRGSLEGPQVVQALRQAWGREVPALVITGDMAPERLQRLRDSGLPWLAKPVMPMRLRGWLGAASPLP